jgi:hypothetical protein
MDRLSPLSRPTPAAPLRATQGPGRPASPAPEQPPQVPEERADINCNPTPPPQKPSRSWVKAISLGVLGATLMAGVINSGIPGLASCDCASPKQAQVQVVDGPKSNAPKVLQEQQAEPLQFQTVRFGVTPTERGFGDAKVELARDNRTESNGTFSHHVQIDRLQTKAGKVLFNNDEAEVLSLEFHDSAQSNWATQSTLKPAGNFGKYVSVAETYTHFGGESSGTETRLRTIDSKTGGVVNLSEIISNEDYTAIANRVQAGLNSPQGLNYRNGSTPEDLDAIMNNGFSLHQAKKDGPVTLTVAVPNVVDTQGQKVAEFTFTLSPQAIH